jgi:hypothetical protein
VAIDTETDPPKLPPGGLKVGVATFSVYDALVSALADMPGAVAMARTFADAVNVIGPLYVGEAVVGTLPSVVK